MPKAHSKRYNSALKVADLNKDYPLAEAVEVLAKFPKAKFDETVELSFCLGVDATAGEQMVSGTTPLPNGSGKKVRVIVFTDNRLPIVNYSLTFGGGAYREPADKTGLGNIVAAIPQCDRHRALPGTSKVSYNPLRG